MLFEEKNAHTISIDKLCILLIADYTMQKSHTKELTEGKLKKRRRTPNIKMIIYIREIMI